MTAEQEAKAIDTDQRLQAVFGSAAYYNEQSGFLDSFQDSFWGGNYERLLSIKQELDPENLFSCVYCVGSESGI
jgi:FAD/FMN-containing dehydrogenase